MNGSVADAAVACMFCSGVVNMHSTGIGGGSFLVHYDRATKKSQVWNFRETAPQNASERMFVNASSSTGL